MTLVPVLLVSLAASGPAQGPVAQQERVICREEKIPNSRFTKRKCMTVSQEEQMRRDAQDAMKRIVDAPIITPPSR